MEVVKGIFNEKLELFWVEFDKKYKTFYNNVYKTQLVRGTNKFMAKDEV